MRKQIIIIINPFRSITLSDIVSLEGESRAIIKKKESRRKQNQDSTIAAMEINPET